MKDFISRHQSREVMVGNVGVGGNNPVRIQSMTTSLTRDIQATATQIKKLADCGCEIARVTVQGKKEAESCEAIKNVLIQEGYTIPLVADIHFYPPAAMLASEFVDKIRINPGNFVDPRASFKQLEYTDASYALELEKIDEVFSPLVLKCKKLKKALRIGANHGSLSDRIMNRYGDTPLGMVESALEFALIGVKHEFHDMIFSMKASNPKVMVEAYHLLVQKMTELGWNYPLHLGVTEAGDGEDGRVKSAIGTGSLLIQGIGDTVRVSLTEDPWEEIAPCKQLANLAKNYEQMTVPLFEKSKQEVKIKPPLHPNGTVILSCSWENLPKDSKADFLYIKNIPEDFKGLPKGCLIITQTKGIPETLVVEKLAYLETGEVALIEDEKDFEAFDTLLLQKAKMLFLRLNKNTYMLGRRFFEKCSQESLDIPVILMAENTPQEDANLIHTAAEMGSFLLNGLGNGICLQSESLGFNILQGVRMRFEKTEFIACPGCGRTLFNLQEVTQKIRSKTEHLKGVKIAIMGCIVNGPGEMADADFGYVGSKTGMVDLYVGKTRVEKNIDSDNALEKLIELIKSHGKWVEKERAY
ncbi:MAG: (E)-4-hydroxy-3-methylbut-2-enyl-diphosphate synthase [Simkaniaceae bacterium]|nr:(E)-4-hydroxy-3-methylbut-2-enyl-diphosphate synthase [Simkaniaceae bacterium]